MSKYLVLDLETGTKEYIGRKACWLVNDIVAIGLKYGQDDFPRYTKSKPYAFIKAAELNFNSCLASWLHGIGIIIGHNIKFDLLYLWSYSEFQIWLKEGGKIFDTQLAEYLLSGQQHTYPALRDIAVNKYGCKERIKYMEEYWDKGIDTKDIPKELVLEDVRNDVLETEQVMLRQVKELKKQGMYKLCMELNESLLATCEMEYNGIYINQEKMQENKKLLESELEVVYTELEKLSEIYYK